MISGASEEELIEAIGRADVLLEFMSKIKQLQQENKKLNGTIQTYDILLKANAEENKQLKDNIRQMDDSVDKLQKQLIKEKDNWNKLKEWLKEYEEGTYGLGSYETGLSDGMGDVIKKMQELEQGSDSNE